MAVDLKALKKASEGDQSTKVTVTKRSLAEIHRALEAGESARAELARRQGGSSDWIDSFFGGTTR